MQYYTLEQQIASFWNQVAITSDDNQCWLFLGTPSDRYGIKKWNGKDDRAHRVAWMIPDYVIPDGMYICHSCDNPRCCNPKHLFLGTPQENSDDMVAKGRQPSGERPTMKGERNPAHKLTADQVILIRMRYAEGNISQTVLGKQFGVGKSIIGYIVNRVWWKDTE